MLIIKFLHLQYDNLILYVPVVTLSTQDNEKLLAQLKSGLKKTKTIWNKYLAKPELLAQNASLNCLIEPSFQGVNRLFVLAFEHDNVNDWRTSTKRYYIPKKHLEAYVKIYLLYIIMDVKIYCKNIPIVKIMM